MTARRPTLAGLTVCLSGAIPERDRWPEPAIDRSILEFVASFTRAVLDRGGRVIHGCHPTFTPVLEAQTSAHPAAPERPLTLVASTLWPDAFSKDACRFAEIVRIPKVGEGDHTDATTRGKSLTALRRELVRRADVLVAVGGLLHDGQPWLPGVTEEVRLAAEAGLPRVVVASFGGDSSRLDGTPAVAGATIVATRDVGRSVGEVIKAVEQAAIGRGPASFSFLHFTDLHVGQRGEGGRYGNIRDAVKRDLDLRHAEGWAWDALFFTGDLAFRGDAVELAIAAHRLEELLEHIRGLTGRTPHLFVVPGNHDIVRPTPRQAKAWRDDLAVSGTRDALFGAPRSKLRAELVSAFAPFDAFSRRLPAPGSMERGLFPGDFAARLVVRGLRVGVVGLNTALLHWDDTAAGRLTVDVRQIQAAMGGSMDLDRNTFNILLTHHPADWLDAVGRRQLETEIYQHDRFNLHLYGHMHLGAQGALAGPRGSCHRSLGRALFAAEGAEDERLHGYTMGRLTLTKDGSTWRREMEIVPREAMQSGMGWLFDRDGAAAGYGWEVRVRSGSSRVPPTQAPADPPPTWRTSWPPLDLCCGGAPLLAPDRKAVFLSAGVPVDTWSDPDATTVDGEAALAAIRDIGKKLREAGLAVVFGGQPGVLAALIQAVPGGEPAEPWLYFVQHRRFEGRQTEAGLALARTPGVQLVWVNGSDPAGGAGGREADLQALRLAMLSVPGIVGAVFIGGKDGVRREFELVKERAPGIPRVAIGRGGGAARVLLLEDPEAKGKLADSGALHGDGPALAAAVCQALGLS